MTTSTFTIADKQAAAELYADTGDATATINTMVGFGFDAAEVAAWVGVLSLDLQKIRATPKPAPAVAALLQPYPGVANSLNPSPSGAAAYFCKGASTPRLVMRLGTPTRVAYYDNFLTEEECTHMLGLGTDSFTRSVVVEEPGEEIHHGRSSETAYLRIGHDEVVTRIEARIAEYFAWPVEKGESLQIIKYEVGQQYAPHFDHFANSDGPNAHLSTPQWQRTATLILYLQDCEAGGSTSFPTLGLSVAAKRGSALFFNYGDDTLKRDMLHAGDPVSAGTKIIATKWFKTLAYQTQ